METVILSRDRFADVTYLPLFYGDLIISIASPGFSHPRPKAISSMRLDVQFHDVTSEIMDGEKLWRCMEDCHAEMIVSHVQEHIPWCDRLIIHCDAGISRSPGVAVGLARFFDIGITENELRDRYPHFNIVVAKKIWTECEKRNFFPLLPEKDNCPIV